jgi:predicted phosphodiesterase
MTDFIPSSTFHDRVGSIGKQETEEQKDISAESGSDSPRGLQEGILPSVKYPSNSQFPRSGFTILVIGDPHFKKNNTEQTRGMVEAIIKIADERKPNLIVCLGDVLDTHAILHTDPLCEAVDFFTRLKTIAPLRVIIGNHDRRNNSDFLTNRHPFTAMSEWSNTVIADRVLSEIIDGHQFIYVPYVPPGRFVEALNIGVDGDISKLYEPARDLRQLLLTHYEQVYRGADDDLESINQLRTALIAIYEHHNRRVEPIATHRNIQELCIALINCELDLQLLTTEIEGRRFSTKVGVGNMCPKARGCRSSYWGADQGSTPACDTPVQYYSGENFHWKRIVHIWNGTEDDPHLAELVKIWRKLETGPIRTSNVKPTLCSKVESISTPSEFNFRFVVPDKIILRDSAQGLVLGQDGVDLVTSQYHPQESPVVIQAESNSEIDCPTGVSILDRHPLAIPYPLSRVSEIDYQSVSGAQEIGLSTGVSEEINPVTHDESTPMFTNVSRRELRASSSDSALADLNGESVPGSYWNDDVPVTSKEQPISKSWWQSASAIFAHQEFYGAKMGAIMSEHGDKWDLDYPLVISGHIHDYQQLQVNVWYTGTPIQHAFGDSTDKTVSVLTWNDKIWEEERVDLGLIKRKSFKLTVHELSDWQPPPGYIVKVKIEGTPGELKTLRALPKISQLRKQGVKVTINTLPEQSTYKFDSSVRQTKTYLLELYDEVLRQTKYRQEMEQWYIGIFGRAVPEPSLVSNSGWLVESNPFNYSPSFHQSSFITSSSSSVASSSSSLAFNLHKNACTPESDCNSAPEPCGNGLKLFSSAETDCKSVPELRLLATPITETLETATSTDLIFKRLGEPQGINPRQIPFAETDCKFVPELRFLATPGTETLETVANTDSIPLAETDCKSVPELRFLATPGTETLETATNTNSIVFSFSPTAPVTSTSILKFTPS